MSFALGAGGGLLLGAAAASGLLLRGAHTGPRADGVLTQAPIAAAVATPVPSPDERAAFGALAARLRSPDAARLEEVRIWHFGPPDERAVCGTLVSPELPGGQARFVVRLLLPRGAPLDPDVPDARPPMTVVEDGPGLVRPTPEASRRFCRQAPQLAAHAAAAAGTSAAPLAAESGGPAAAPREEAAGIAAPLGRMLTQAPANLRAGPGGPVLSVIPRGRILNVYDRAPGGWLLIGDAEPLGWIHASLLVEAPTARAE